MQRAAIILIKMEDLIGLPAIACDTGRNLGIVIQVVYQPGEKRINGFIIKGKKKSYYSADLLAQIGQVSLLLKTDRPEKVSSRPENNLSRPVVNARGEEIGRLIQPWIDEKTGRVAALEASRGWLDDLRKGRWLIERFYAVEFSKEIIALSRFAAAAHEIGGGLLYEDEIDDHGGNYRRGGGNGIRTDDVQGADNAADDA